MFLKIYKFLRHNIVRRKNYTRHEYLSTEPHSMMQHCAMCVFPTRSFAWMMIQDTFRSEFGVIKLHNKPRFCTLQDQNS
jgi:hypothetical protein